MLKQNNRYATTLLPASIDEYVPAKHVARYVVDMAEDLDLSELEAQYSTTMGRKGYRPVTLLTLWLYGYMKGINSSRKLEQATRENMVFMYIAAGQHPDHSTLSQFRKRNGEAFKKAASEFLQMLVNVGLVDLKTLAIDGTKLKANAAREKMVTAATAHRRIQVIDKHLQDMSEQMDRAEAEDNLGAPLALVSPAVEAAIKKRRAEKKELLELVAELKAEDARRLAEEQASYEEKMAARQRYQQETGKTKRGRSPQPPGDQPSRVAHRHMTDAEAKLMKSREGIVPGYNAQAGVDIDTQLIVTADVTTDATDHQQVEPVLEALSEQTATQADSEQASDRINLLADAGYYSAANVAACETANVNAYIAKHRNGTVTEPKVKQSKDVSKMVKRMTTDEGKALYRRRKSSVETTFGCIKEAMGFRVPRLRGLAGVQTEWQLVCLAWNLKRAFNLWGRGLC
ncbi:MAG: IS1182 family transposase [Gammaproteobacteria bacterium]|nr:IS1182 family transposase [Gammaproteobacteria bacterium]